MKYFFLIIIYIFSNALFAQIIINNDSPNDSPIYLVDNILLGSGVEAFGHQYMGDSIQIGFFDGLTSNLGLNSGIVMSTGDIAILDPTYTGFGDFIDVNPVVTDPDLLNVANTHLVNKL